MNATHSQLKSPAKSTGYTVMRAGRLPEMDVCLALPHVGVPLSAKFDAISKRLELDLGATRLLLAELPTDVVALMSKSPDRVLVITVDTLSQPKTSARLDELSRVTH